MFYATYPGPGPIHFSLGVIVISCWGVLKKFNIINNSRPHCPYWFSILLSCFGRYDPETGIKFHSMVLKSLKLNLVNPAETLFKDLTEQKQDTKPT